MSPMHCNSKHNKAVSSKRQWLTCCRTSRCNSGRQAGREAEGTLPAAYPQPPRLTGLPGQAGRLQAGSGPACARSSWSRSSAAWLPRSVCGTAAVKVPAAMPCGRCSAAGVPRGVPLPPLAAVTVGWPGLPQAAVPSTLLATRLRLCCSRRQRVHGAPLGWEARAPAAVPPAGRAPAAVVQGGGGMDHSVPMRAHGSAGAPLPLS